MSKQEGWEERRGLSLIGDVALKPPHLANILWAPADCPAAAPCPCTIPVPLVPVPHPTPPTIFMMGILCDWRCCAGNLVAAASEAQGDPRVIWPRKACGDLCGSSLGQPCVVKGSFSQGGGQGPVTAAEAGGDLLCPLGAPRWLEVSPIITLQANAASLLPAATFLGSIGKA